MGKGNVAVNQLFRNKERFADMFNARVFHGQQIVKPDELQLVESESDVLLEDKDEKKKSYQRYRDVVMCWQGKVDLAILACENQEKVHYAMPIRNMLYDGLSYTEQARAIWESHKTTGIKPTEEEYLSRFFKEDHIAPVITIVFYYGNKVWDGPMNLYDMFDIENEDMKETLEQYVPNYWINLIHPQDTEEYHFVTDLQLLFDMLKYRKDKCKIIECINKNKGYFQSMDKETYLVLEAFLNLTQDMKKHIKKDQGEERFDMCEALLEYYQDGVNEGIEKGIEKGFI